MQIKWNGNNLYQFIHVKPKRNIWTIAPTLADDSMLITTTLKHLPSSSSSSHWYQTSYKIGAFWRKSLLAFHLLIHDVMVVEQYTHGLTKNAKEAPEYYISHHWVLKLALQVIRQYHQWNLKHDPDKGPKLENVAGNSNTKLMEHSRHEKCNQDSSTLRDPITQAWKIKMSYNPFMNRHIP